MLRKSWRQLAIPVLCLAVSAVTIGAYIRSKSTGRYLVYRVESGAEIKSIDTAGGSIAFSTAGGEVLLVDQKELQRDAFHGNFPGASVRWVDMQLAISVSDGSVQIRQPGAPTPVVIPISSSLNQLAYCETRRVLFTVDETGVVSEIDPKTRKVKRLATIKLEEPPVTIDCSASGSTVGISSLRHIYLLNPKTKGIIKKDIGDSNGRIKIAVSPHDNGIAFVRYNSTTSLNATILPVQGNSSPTNLDCGYGCSAVSFGAVADRFVTADHETGLKVWDLASKQVLQSFPVPNITCLRVKMSYIVAGTSDGKVFMFPVQ